MVEMETAIAILSLIIAIVATVIALNAWEAAERSSTVQSWYGRYADCRAAWIHLNDFKTQIVVLHTVVNRITPAFNSNIGLIEGQMIFYNQELEALERYVFDNRYINKEELLFKTARLDSHNIRIMEMINTIQS